VSERWRRWSAVSAALCFRCDRLLRAVFAISVLLDGESERPQQRTSLVVGLRGGHDSDVHVSHVIDAVLIDLVEHDLFGEPEGVVAVAVEVLPGQATDVTDTGQAGGQAPVPGLPPAVGTHGDVRTD